MYIGFKSENSQVFTKIIASKLNSFCSESQASNVNLSLTSTVQGMIPAPGKSTVRQTQEIHNNITIKPVDWLDPADIAITSVLSPACNVPAVFQRFQEMS